jgi:hypothetical protein
MNNYDNAVRRHLRWVLPTENELLPFVAVKGTINKARKSFPKTYAEAMRRTATSHLLANQRKREQVVGKLLHEAFQERYQTLLNHKKQVKNVLQRFKRNPSKLVDNPELGLILSKEIDIVNRDLTTLRTAPASTYTSRRKT